MMVPRTTTPHPTRPRCATSSGAAFVRNPRLKERWEGGTQGLRDDTRSGRDMSVLAMLVAAGFTKGETRAALLPVRAWQGRQRTAALLRAHVVRTKAVPSLPTRRFQARRRTANVLALVTHINTSPGLERRAALQPADRGLRDMSAVPATGRRQRAAARRCAIRRTS